MISVDRIDHVVLTVRDIEATCDFYSRVLGMRHVLFGDSRHALEFGRQKINLHQAGKEFEPKAKFPTPGSADLCLITLVPVEALVEYLKACHVDIVQGPGPQVAAAGALTSVYFRDPDGNLIEVSNYVGSVVR